MKFLADENIAAPMISAMREASIDVMYVAELNPGILDEEVLAIARQKGRLLLTEDKDFGELVIRMRHELPGIIMLRLPPGPWQTRWKRFQHLLDHHADRLNGTYSVVETNRVRFRPLV